MNPGPLAFLSESSRRDRPGARRQEARRCRRISYPGLSGGCAMRAVRQAAILLFAVTILPSGARAEMCASPAELPADIASSARVRQLEIGPDGVVRAPSPGRGPTQQYRVTILLPPEYDVSQRRYPVLLLLHGSLSDRNSWLIYSDLFDFTNGIDDEHQVIVVMPNGSPDGSMVDWQSGAYKPDTWTVSALIPAIDREFRTVPDRAHRAVAGLSIGGLGSIHFAVEHPDLVSVVAAFSGTLPGLRAAWQPGPLGMSLSTAFWVAACDDEDPNAFHPSNGFYDPLEVCDEELCAHESNPVERAEHLRSSQVDLYIGDGRPCDLEDVQTMIEQDATKSTETAWFALNETFKRDLDAAAVNHSYHYYGCGIHSWRYWQRDLHDWWSRMHSGFAAAHPPATFDYRSSKGQFTVWDWTVVADDARAAEFLELRDASCAGLTLKGSGTTFVTTAPCFHAGAAVLISEGDESRTVTSDAEGRLSFSVALGAPHSHQQYSPDARLAEASDAGYWTTRTVTLEPE